MLFDTSVVIDYLRGTDATATDYVLGVIDGTPGFLSVITEAELWVGIRDTREAELVDALFSCFNIIPVNSGIAQQAGAMLQRMNTSQIKAHFADALIAATALEIGESILTADGRSKLVFGNRVNYPVYR